MKCLLKISKNFFQFTVYQTYDSIMIQPWKTITVNPNNNNIVLKLNECEYEYKNFDTGKKTIFYQILIKNTVLAL